MMEMTIIHGTVVLQNAGTLSFFYEDTDEFRCRFTSPSNPLKTRWSYGC
jgi:hypothetical protein